MPCDYCGIDLSRLSPPEQAQHRATCRVSSGLRRSGSRRLLTEKDLAGLYQVTRFLAEQDRDRSFVYVGLGRSPAVLMEYMRQAFRLPTLEVPLGGLSGGIAADYRVVKKLFEACCPIGAIRGKTLVVVDYAYSGKSIDVVADLLDTYAKDIDAGAKVLTAPITFKGRLQETPRSLMRGFDQDTRAAHRLLKALFLEIDKEHYAPMRSLKYEDLASSAVVPRDLRLHQKAMALQEVMELALRLLAERGIELESSEYLKKRKRLKGKFSASYGYSPAAEEAWINNLRYKSASFVRLDRGLVVPYVSADAERARARQRRQQRLNLLKRCGARACNLIFVFLVLYAVFWFYVSYIARRTVGPEIADL